MLSKLPRQLPSFQLLLDDLACNRAQIAKALHCTDRQLAAWTANDDAPRCVQLALFWPSIYGQSEIAAEATNAARLHAQIAEALRREIAHANSEIARLHQIGDFGSANDPGVSPGYRRPGSMASPLSHLGTGVSALRVTIPNASSR